MEGDYNEELEEAIRRRLQKLPQEDIDELLGNTPDGDGVGGARVVIDLNMSIPQAIELAELLDGQDRFDHVAHAIRRCIVNRREEIFLPPYPQPGDPE